MTYTSRKPNRSRRPLHGFTLIELLVIIGIIGILAAFLLPALYKAWKGGVATKTKADFQIISVALEAFKSDTGDYPRVESPNTGFAVLAKALVGPFGDGVVPPPPNSPPNTPPTLDPTDPPGFAPPPPPGTYKPGDVVRNPLSLPPAGLTYVCIKENAGTAPPDPIYWVAYGVNDLRDGPGTKIRAGGAPQGPYLQPDRIRMRGCALLDGDGNPILYFPASPVKPNINSTTGEPFVSRGSKTSVFDAYDNVAFFLSGGDSLATPTNAVKAIRAMLGDFNPQNDNDATNYDGTIQSDKGEAALTLGPYILWAPGNDGSYGPINKGQTPYPTKADIAKCDDVTNFK